MNNDSLHADLVVHVHHFIHEGSTMPDNATLDRAIARLTTAIEALLAKLSAPPPEPVTVDEVSALDALSDRVEAAVTPPATP
jgi:hypothetical protein